jgi:hypothetical protein
LAPDPHGGSFYRSKRNETVFFAKVAILLNFGRENRHFPPNHQSSALLQVVEWYYGKLSPGDLLLGNLSPGDLSPLNRNWYTQ